MALCVPDLTDNLSLLRAYRAGDREAGETLAKINHRLVCHLAERFRSRVSDLSDLIECGQIGLCKAMGSFDLDRGVAFSTYAVPLILGEMRRFLRDDGTIKVSREEKRLCAQLLAERERRAEGGLDVSVGALAKAVGVSPADAASALFAQTPVRSLDEPIGEEEEGATFGSQLADEDESVKTNEYLALSCAIETLSEPERKLILLRYFRDLSQTEVAALLGLPQVKVSREEKRILEKLRTRL